jgi:CopG family transcriptional regulator/antitoxin EndoAI
MKQSMIDGNTPGVILSCQEVTIMNSKVTVSLHPSLLAFLDRLAQKWKTTRSGALAELLRQAEQKEIEKEMEEGYIALAEVNKAETEAFLSAQLEVVDRDEH